MPHPCPGCPRNIPGRAHEGLGVVWQRECPGLRHTSKSSSRECSGYEWPKVRRTGPLEKKSGEVKGSWEWVGGPQQWQGQSHQELSKGHSWWQGWTSKGSGLGGHAELLETGKGRSARSWTRTTTERSLLTLRPTCPSALSWFQVHWHPRTSTGPGSVRDHTNGGKPSQLCIDQRTSRAWISAEAPRRAAHLHRMLSL